MDTSLGERFLVTSRGSVTERLGLLPLPLLREGDRARFSKGEVWGKDEGFLSAEVSSHTLCDFLWVSSCESTNMLCRSGLRG